LAGKGRVKISLNETEQSLELGPVSVVNYGPDYPIEQLTRGLTTYEGRAADAPWRAEAAERIKKYRTGPIEVRVVDADGVPVVGASVAVEMGRHAFAFGSAVNTVLLTLPEEDFPAWSGETREWEDAKRYREIVRRHFNRVTPTGALRPHSYFAHRDPDNSPFPGFARNQGKAYDLLKPFRETYGVEIRGHYLSWGATQHGAWADVGGSRDEHYRYMSRVLDRMPAECGDVVDEWDALNHPCGWGVSIEDLYGGLDMHVEIMRRARENAPPGTPMYINEGHVITERSRIPDYERVIKYLTERGQGPDGIGMMAHFDRAQLTGMSDAWDVLERFAKLAPRLELTELDVSTSGDDELQADYLRDIMTLCFSHPRMDGIVMWGFWEGAHWKPETALWREDWSVKPSGEAWLKLVKDDWWTTETVTTDADGRAVVPNAFFGDYEIAITSEGETRRHVASHMSDTPTRLRFEQE
ncbi:MAG: endo-1,4-beta-xylanase, partial [Planctomycetota bacterium]